MTHKYQIVRMLLALSLAMLTQAGLMEPQGKTSVPGSNVIRTFNSAEETDKSGAPPSNEELIGFRFHLSGFRYEVTYSGKGKRTCKRKSLNFRLDPDETDGFYLTRIQYAEYLGDVILICECSNSEGGGGFLTRLDGKSLKRKWSWHIPAFNIGEGLIENCYVYLTAIGTIAKLDLDSGVEVWQHDDLYVPFESAHPDKCCHFNSFELPKIDGNDILFKEETSYPPAETLKVDKHTGKILGVSPQVGSAQVPVR